MIRSRDVVRVVGVSLTTVGGDQPKESPNDDKQDQRDFTIRTTSRLVLLDVSVKDSQGAFVTGLYGAELANKTRAPRIATYRISTATNRVDQCTPD